MNCRKVRRRLVPLLDSELAASEAELVAGHLDRCTECAGYLARLEQTAPSAPIVQLSEELLHQSQLRILSALDAEPLPRAHPDQPGPIWRMLGGEVRLPRGLVVLYAAALLGAVVWAASSTVGISPAPDVATTATEAPVRASVQLHQPAAYTPSDGWF